MTRPGTVLARQILGQIKTDFDVDIGDLRSKRGDATATAAKVAYVVRGKELGLTYVVLAEVLGVHWTALWNRVHPKTQEKQRLSKRRQRAEARENRRPSGWSIPTWDGFRHQPSIEFHEGTYDAICN